MTSAGESLRFEPWIGEHYFSQGLAGVRILALGESHYCEASFARPTFTTEVVNECVFQGRSAYFTKVAKLLLGLGTGAHLDDEVRRDVWRRIAFYNFVQQSLPRPRVRPTAQMWQQGKDLFPEVVDQLQPQLIVVMGKQLWEWFVPPSGIEVCFTEHPSSSSFRYEPWAQDIQAKLSQCAAGVAAPSPPGSIPPSPEDYAPDARHLPTSR